MINRTSDAAHLRDLYARYAFALDHGSTADVLDCLTPDGVFSLSDRGDFVGHEQIRVIIDATGENRDRHFITNVIADFVSDDRAEVRAYFNLFRVKDGATMGFGNYTDTAVRCADGGWRWNHKRIHFEWRHNDYAERAKGLNVEVLLTSD